MKIISIIGALLICLAINPLEAQETKELAMSFSDNNASKSLEINIFNASINVIGTNRSDVLLTYSNEPMGDDKHDNDKVPK